MKYSYLLVLFAAFIMPGCKKRQNADPAPVSDKIIYTTPQSAVIKYNNRYPVLDLNQDGSADFTFGIELQAHDNSVLTQFKVLPTPGNQLVVFDVNDAYSLIKNATIAESLSDKNTTWQFNNAIMLEKRERADGIERQGWWNGSVNQYLGVRVKRNAQYYYGWIELTHQISSTGEDQLIVTRTAIETVPNKAINAGY
jgi:hypothetical protein